MEQRPKSKLSTAALVMGILSVVFVLLPFGSMIFGILGLIFAIICLAKKKGSKGKSVWGLILSIVGLLGRVLATVAVVVILIAGGTIGFLSLGTIMATVGPYLSDMGIDTSSIMENIDDGSIDLNESDDWRYSYLPSKDVMETNGIEFTVPEGFEVGDLREDEYGKNYILYSDDAAYYFPEVVYEYSSSDYYEAYDEFLDYWFAYPEYSEYIPWMDDRIDYWNDDWYVTGLDYDDGDSYSYCLIAFSTHSNKIVLLSCFPYSNEYDEACMDTQFLLQYIEE